ncbi:hypothetical protein KKI91_23285, partial [Xenorhabdus bovienii]|uniref:hypothetical protein n=1 Tax=Xenorhabdus bovienii TaxID=40576 RepID=UPI0023B2B6C4
SEGFAAKMNARLDAEPIMIVPQLKAVIDDQVSLPTAVNGVSARKRLVRRFVMPGTAVAAAVIAVAFVTAPRQSVTMADNRKATQ